MHLVSYGASIFSIMLFLIHGLLEVVLLTLRPSTQGQYTEYVLSKDCNCLIFQPGWHEHVSQWSGIDLMAYPKSRWVSRCFSGKSSLLCRTEFPLVEQEQESQHVQQLSEEPHRPGFHWKHTDHEMGISVAKKHNLVRVPLFYSTGMIPCIPWGGIDMGNGAGGIPENRKCNNN